MPAARPFAEGDRVVLRAGRYGPRQTGEVIGVDPDAPMLTVLIDERCIEDDDDGYDDGIREVGEDQCEKERTA